MLYPATITMSFCFLSLGMPHPTSSSSRSGMELIPSTSVYIARMDQLVQHYLKHLLAPSTLLSYSAAEKQYVQFCQHLNIAPIPATELTLCQYVACLVKQQFKTPAIKCYLFCMRYLEIMGGSSDSFEQSIPLLEYNGGSGDSFE